MIQARDLGRDFGICDPVNSYSLPGGIREFKSWGRVCSDEFMVKGVHPQLDGEDKKKTIDVCVVCTIYSVV